MPVFGSVVVESTVAALVLSDANVIVSPVMGRPNWSKDCAVNCVDCPTMTLADGGEMAMLVNRAGQLPKGVPSTFRPAVNLRPLAPVAAICCTKLPVMSGERVND